MADKSQDSRYLETQRVLQVNHADLPFKKLIKV